MIDYSIVIPCYFSESSVRKTAQEISNFFSTRNVSYEIIFVDDASNDNTWSELKKIKQEFPNVKLIRFAKNFGQHAATLCGFKFAKGDIIITMDDDLEVHPDQIQQLIEEYKRTGNDVVYGEYKKLNQPFFRGALSGIYKYLAKLAEGDNSKGKGSPFRLLKSDLAKKLTEEHRSFVFIDELLLWYTQRISFVRVNANPNFIKKGRYSITGLFRLTANVIMFSSTFPLKLVTQIGFLLAFVNFVIGVFYLIKKFLLRIEVLGFTSIIVSILFSTGLIILTLGIIAQYISRILKDVNNKPSYYIAEQNVDD